MAKDVRLQKLIADCGIASRRKAEEMISAGEVKVNGVTAKIGDKVDPQKDKVSIRGKFLDAHVKEVYIMLHKPRGFITTMSDEMNRKCVAELVKDIPERVYPVGRLDRESEGLLLMTNDGEFANAMTHPSLHIPKTYRVTVRPGITEDQLTQIAVGIVIDGRKTAPAKVNVISQEAGRVVLEIVLYEGRNRQIRKMCEQLGLKVARLKRIAVGPVKLGMLQPGKWRPLTNEEVKKLMAGAKEGKSRKA
ncbi:rRNA pseudouridine synthase [Caproiciproducens galactitolivorans]|uniref:Pseudouridine synthase n=1 Tax=Caproiciproducens galactitolivorans TaxID=642589 RepID=A0A4Z0YFX3_9FIRM|nr:pseudouridine synthase [Caproiciproducens galactitolivorans]QEY34024.1 rRNA pseudouridine synthase [Caproiciproducens galactitolivorans]TGJ76566.1 ribosomal large subunit pseudouridine synthase B [Caproiciproducens galactitolivorans]